MKKTYPYSLFARYLTLLVLALLSTNLAWGEITSPWSHTFASGDITTSAQTNKSLSNINWAIDAATYAGYDATKGEQIGSGNNPQKSDWTMSTPISSFGTNVKITSVSINISTASSGGITYKIEVGDQSKTESLGETTSVTKKTLDNISVSSGNIKITLNSNSKSKAIYIKSITVTFEEAADPTEPNLSVSPTAIDFGTVYQDAEVGAQDVTVTFANLTINDVTAAISGSAFSINKTGSFTSGDKITITPNTANLGEYSETLTVSATGVDDQKVTVTMNVVKAPTLETYNKVTSVDDLAEGDIIVLASSTTAYGTEPGENHKYIDATKFTDSQSASLTGNVLKAADAFELTLGKSGDNWTMTSENGLVGTTGATTMTFGYNSATNTWSISIDGNANASITSTTSTYGTIKYNSSSPRFLNYTSNQTAIQIYKKAPKPLASISVTNDPSKTLYKVGETFDAAGLVITGTYSDGSTNVLNSTQYSLSTPDMSSAGQKTVTVSATDEIKTTFTIDVVALDKIEITTAPNKTAYNEGDNFDATGMVVKGTWGTEEGKIIVENNLTGYTVTDGTNLQPTQTYVTVSYTHAETTKTATQDITVTAAANKYAVTFTNVTEEGTLTVKVGDEEITTGTELVEGVIVSLTSTPNSGYKQHSTPFEVKDADGGSVSVSTSGGVRSFVMPAKAVTITAKFVAVYAINVADGIQGGSIKIQDKDGNPITETSKGSKVVVAVTPNDHHSLTSLYYIKTGEETHNTIALDSDEKYSFTMIESDVTVYATFAEDAKYTVTFSIIGRLESKSNYASEQVEFPEVSNVGDYTFMGWTTTAIPSTQQEAPKFVNEEDAVYPENNNTLYYAVFAKKSGSENYVKVTSTSDLTDGKYLIVYETGKVALNGALNSDQVSNTVSVEISNSEIESTNTIDAAAVTFKATNGSFLGGGGKYIGHTGSKNTLDYSDTAFENTVTFDDEGNAVIAAGSYVMRYNATSGQTRFRYYTSGQQAVQLYKKQEATFSNYCTTVSGQTVPVTVNPIGNASFCSTVDLDFPKTDDVKAYIAVSADENIITLNRRYKIPAGTGIFVLGTGGTYNIPTTTEECDDVSGNLLTGTIVPYTVQDEDNVWALSKNDGLLYHIPSGRTIGAGKAYYSNGSLNSASLSLFIVDEPTGINSINENVNENENLYNLQGMRVSTPKKGEVYIMNGKKFLMK